MKKIILIGDSIRLGYQAFIKQSLAGIAEVYFPDGNSEYAINVLRFAHDWKRKGGFPTDADLVHWNAGLWDVSRIFGDEPLTPIETYGEWIGRIDKRLRLLFPSAQMVFATNTAVYEPGYGKDFRRCNADICAYNAKARQVLAGTDTIIDDLYTVTLDAPESCRSDMTHFNTADGVELVGGAVLRKICETLRLDFNAVTARAPEKISSEKLGY